MVESVGCAMKAADSKKLTAHNQINDSTIEEEEEPTRDGALFDFLGKHSDCLC